MADMVINRAAADSTPAAPTDPLTVLVSMTRLRVSRTSEAQTLEDLPKAAAAVEDFYPRFSTLTLPVNRPLTDSSVMPKITILQLSPLKMSPLKMNPQKMTPLKMNPRKMTQLRSNEALAISCTSPDRVISVPTTIPTGIIPTSVHIAVMQRLTERLPIVTDSNPFKRENIQRLLK